MQLLHTFFSCNAAVLNTALKYCVSNALIFGRFVSRLFVYNYYHVTILSLFIKISTSFSQVTIFGIIEI